jgi:hypothetical protein
VVAVSAGTSASPAVASISAGISFTVAIML